MTTLIIRPDLGRRAYRLRCRFTIDAYPRAVWLAQAKFEAAESFVADMRKQGFEYVDRYGFKLSGPYPAITPVTLPTRSQQERWQVPSAEMLPQVLSGKPPRASSKGYVTDLPGMEAMERWDYELAGVFVHKTILVETPSEAEEKKVLAQR